MTFALGVLKWPPEAFWGATYYDLSCAYIGHLKEKGLIDDSMADFWEDYQAMKRRFPDKPAPKREGG